MKKLRLLKSDVDYINEYKEEFLEEGRLYKDSDFFNRSLSVKSQNILSIFSRDELISSFLLIPQDFLKDTCIISIREPGRIESEDFINIDCHDLIDLQFTDIRKDFNPEDINDENIIVFDEKQLKEIEIFIIRNFGKRFLINCDAGISRSSAIGVFVEHLHNNNEGIQNIKNHFRYSPNPKMIELMKRVYFLDY